MTSRRNRDLHIVSAEQLGELLAEHELTNEEMGRMCGVSNQCVSKWRREGVRGSAAVLVRMMMDSADVVQRLQSKVTTCNR